MPKTFLISDMHFGHENIIRYENRPFNNADEMDEAMICNWNNTVGASDEVFILGDVSFHNEEKTAGILNRLNGRKVLILGNHDRDRSAEWWKKTGIDEVYQYPIIYDGFFIFSHEPVYLNPNMPYANIHGHLHHLKYADNQFFNVSVECIDYTPILFGEVRRKLMEYPYESHVNC